MGRLQRRLPFGLASAFALAVASLSGSVVSAQQPHLRADLESRPIKPSEASSYYCHDFAFPAIHCFSTPEGLEASLSGSASQLSRAAVVVAAVGPSDYVTVYSGSSYSGSFAHLSQNYDALAVIGWNDTISSYKGRNSRSGVFYQHWFAGGTATRFCCNQNVPNLPSGTDNSFSSVYRT
jgi:hypothetical protein